VKTIQANVRVAPEDKAVITGIASRLRSEPGFRDKLVALLNDRAGPGVAQRLDKLEEQVARLESGAIVVPRAKPPTAITLPRKAKPPSP